MIVQNFEPGDRFWYLKATPDHWDVDENDRYESLEEANNAANHFMSIFSDPFGRDTITMITVFRVIPEWNIAR